MARLTIYKDNDQGSTVVSNYFIDHYMKDANDAQLKVYFYLLRMLNANAAISVSDIADKFNHTERDVMRALRYWEEKQLLNLDFDGEENLVGIHLKELGRKRSGETVAADRSASGTGSRTAQIRTVAEPAGTGKAAFEATGRDAAAFEAVAFGATDKRATAFEATGRDAAAFGTAAFGSTDKRATAFETAGRDAAAFGTTDKETASAPNSTVADNPFQKPVYTAEQLREFKSRQETAQLLFIAQSYIGKPLTPSEIKSVLFFMDGLHFSEDLVDYLIQYCVDRGKKDFKYIEKVAIRWAEQGITTPRQAQKYSTRYDKNVYAIMNQLGKSNSPTDKEMEFINRWINEYGFTNDIIFEACERTVLATDKHRFEYADSILSSWRKENVHRKSDILRIDELYQQRRKASSKPSGNKFNQFKQNDYDFASLEDDIVSN